MDIWKDFSERLHRLFEFTNGKKIIIWGYGYSGWFLEHLFRQANRQVEYFVDDGKISRKLNVYRSFILEDLDKDTHAVILSFQHDDKAESFLEKAGYIKDIHYIYARDIFYGEAVERPLSYYGWMEHRYALDIQKFEPISELEHTNQDSQDYSPGVDYALPEILDNFVFSDKDAVFDFGCGKGAALILFAKYGLKRLGGVEYDSELYGIIKHNFQKIRLDSSCILHGDAAKVVRELDSYNYFFMYNPFVGETFRMAIRHMEESADRNPRRITFIYTGAWLHRDVVAGGRFKLAKQIYTDSWIRYANIYTITP